MTDEKGPFGARIYLMSSETVLVYQTRKRGTAQNAPYIVDGHGSQAGMFVELSDDKGIADAVRAALSGKIT